MNIAHKLWENNGGFMGRKSTKENKNIYQISREEVGLTREAAAEKMDYISSKV